MNRYHLVHITEFLYDGPVSESYNEVRLRPIHDEKQSCLSFRLTTNARFARHCVSRRVWQLGAPIQRSAGASPPEGGGRIRGAGARLIGRGSPIRPHWRNSIAGKHQLDEEYFDFVAPSAYVPHLNELREIIEAAEEASDGTVAGFAQAASDLIHERFRYVKGATHVHSSIEDSLSVGAGVCQDFAHVLLGVARMRGLPGRYVSGYLVPGSAASADARQEEVIGGQASHAWAEVFMPTTGWTGFDPTLGKPVGLRHVRVAYGRDYGDVAPVRGVYKGQAGQRLSVDVRVRPALDDEGREQLSTAAPVPAKPRLPSGRSSPRSNSNSNSNSNSSRLRETTQQALRFSLLDSSSRFWLNQCAADWSNYEHCDRRPSPPAEPELPGHCICNERHIERSR